MERKLPPMPGRIAALPMERGLPVIYVTDDSAVPSVFEPDPLLPPGWIAMMNGPAEGKSRPRFGAVNPERQRRAVLLGLCGVCGVQLGRKRYYVSGDWDDAKPGALLTEPPVCLPCLRWSLQVCPALLTGRRENRLIVTTDPDNTVALWFDLNMVDVFQRHTIVRYPWDHAPEPGVVTFLSQELLRDRTTSVPADEYL